MTKISFIGVGSIGFIRAGKNHHVCYLDYMVNDLDAHPQFFETIIQ